MSAGRSVAATVAVGFVVAGILLLFAGGDIGFGSPPVELRGEPYELSALLAGLAAAGIAVFSPPARIPVGASVLVSTNLIMVGGLTGVLTFYDAGGLGLALGLACLGALWPLLYGRRLHRPWSRDLPRRALSYVTVAVVLFPVSLSTGVSVACRGADPDDDLCGLGWVLLGVPATGLVWLLAIAATEVIAAGRRRRSSPRRAGTRRGGW